MTSGIRRGALPLLIGLLAGALLLFAGQGDARKLGNPGTSTSFTATVISPSSIKVGSQTFSFSSGDPVTIAGSVNNTTGAISVPASGVDFPELEAGGFPVHINVVEGLTGSLNPLTGSLVINNLRVWIKIDDVPFGGGCRIASAGSPIVVSPLTVNTSGSVNGTEYDPSNGTAKVVNGTFSVPGSSDCGPAGGTVDSTVGIPSGSGNNNAQFTLDFNPTLTKGVIASFTTSQPTAVPPLNVSFDASGSTRTCTPNPCSYRWDWDNNGTTDTTTSTATTSHQYGTAGSKTAALTVVDTDGDTDKTTRTFNVALAPDLEMTKSHTGNFLAGTNESYTLNVSNEGTGATQGVMTVTDTLPTGLSFISGTGTSWSCSAVGQAVTCTRSGAIAGGSSSNITLNVAVANNAPASVTNTATVTTVSVPPEASTANNSDSDPTTIDRIDLGIDKSHDHDFKTGTVETYELDVTNSGSVATNGTTTVSDTLPGGITFQSASAPPGWSCGAVGQTVTCTNPNPIPVGADQIDLNVVAGATAADNSPVTNTATVDTPDDSNSANDSSSDPTNVIATVDLTIDKSHSGAFRIGSEASYTIAVQNRGARPSASQTTVHDTLPDGLIPTDATGTGWNCVIAGQAVDCTHDASLGASESAGLITIDVDVTSSAALPTVTNTATVATPGTGDDADSNPANDSDSDLTTITFTDVTIDKSHLGGFPLGGQGTYTLSVSNVGTAPTVGPTTVTDTLPAELTFVNASGTGWSCGAVGQDVTCTRTAAIGAGQTAPPITLVVDVADIDDEEAVNSATVSAADDDDFNSGSDSDTDPTPLTAADLEITKSHTGDFRVGAHRAYVIRVSNVGSKVADDETTVTDTLPQGLIYEAVSGSGWSCSPNGQEVTCTRSAAIGPGADAPAITLEVQVGDDAYPLATNVVEVSNDDDRNDANDTASDPTTILGADLAVSKSHLGSLQVNDRASYLIDVSNPGTADTNTPATISDQLPDGLTYAGSPSQDWDCAAAGQIVTCEHSGSIGAGQSAETLELRADVDSSAADEVTNTANVSLSDDVNSANDSDSDTADVGQIDLSIEKATAEGELPRGDVGSYTIDVENEGTDPTDGPTHVTDTLPADVSYESAAGTGWSCSVAAGVVDCLHSGTIEGGASAAPLTLNVNVAPDAGAQITNDASVSTSDDADASNDSDGDTSDVTGGLDAAVSINPTGDFRVGSQSNYRVTVRSVGSADITDPVVATVDLPTGLTYVDADGPGFNCSVLNQQVTCTDPDGMPAGTRSDIALEVDVAKTASPGVTTMAAVDAANDMDDANDTAAAPTTVSMIDVAIAMQHSGSFAPGAQSQFTINVENVGSANTISPVRVVDNLPAGLTFNSGTGTGWTCNAFGQLVICNLPDGLAAGAQAPTLTLAVTPSNGIGGLAISNQALVQTTDDAENANNSATDGVTIGPAPTTSPPPQSTPSGGQVAGTTKGCKKKKGKKGSAAAAKKCKRKKK